MTYEEAEKHFSPWEFKQFDVFIPRNGIEVIPKLVITRNGVFVAEIDFDASLGVEELKQIVIANLVASFGLKI